MTRKFGGLGLGLALAKLTEGIARQIVELHGLTISVQSQGEGEGATFIVCLPRFRNTELEMPSKSIDACGDRVSRP